MPAPLIATQPSVRTIVMVSTFLLVEDQTGNRVSGVNESRKVEPEIFDDNLKMLRCHARQKQKNEGPKEGESLLGFGSKESFLNVGWRPHLRHENATVRTVASGPFYT
jgi:hypothetical protein